MVEELNEISANEITERDNLAMIVRVKELEAIPNKDRIELVRFENFGYDAICEKGHKVGDLVVFVKYDSIVPDNELFAFMKEFKFRVKPRSFTERDDEDNIVKKIYSQGIVLPLQNIVDFLLTQNTMMYEQLAENAGMLEGVDATTYLDIKKYIPPVVGSGSSFGQMQSKGDFPSHIVSKTDEVNLASKVRALEELQGKRVYISLKIEGSSLTTMWDDGRDELMVCSRNNQIGEHETNKFWKAINKYNMKEKVKECSWLIFQGELFGEGIQKNKLGIQGVDVNVFNIIDKRTGRECLTFYEMVDACKELDIPMVPVVCIIENFDWTFDQLQEFADIQRYSNGELAEGIVVRPTEPFFSKVLKQNWSVKVISREYKF